MGGFTDRRRYRGACCGGPPSAHVQPRGTRPLTHASGHVISHAFPSFVDHSSSCTTLLLSGSCQASAASPKYGSPPAQGMLPQLYVAFSAKCWAAGPPAAAWQPRCCLAAQTQAALHSMYAADAPKMAAVQQLQPGTAVLACHFCRAPNTAHMHPPHPYQLSPPFCHISWEQSRLDYSCLCSSFVSHS